LEADKVYPVNYLKKGRKRRGGRGRRTTTLRAELNRAGVSSDLHASFLRLKRSFDLLKGSDEPSVE